MATGAEQFVSDWLTPFFQSIKAVLTFTDTPRLSCFIMQTGHLIFFKDGIWSVSDPDISTEETAQKLRGLLALTAIYDRST